MGQETKIEWCDHTFNGWWGCQKVSQGCSNCYAESLSKRWGEHIWGPPSTTSRRIMGEKYWREPLKWDREAGKLGVRRRVFSASMSDVFEDHKDVATERVRLLHLIDSTPNLQWLLLTKRPENIMEMLEFSLLILYEASYVESLESPQEWLQRMGDRVWVGTSIEDQENADKRIPHLLAIPAKIRFLSLEPLLGPVDLWGARYRQPDGSLTGAISTWAGEGIHWAIIGGESGPGSRPLDLQWIRDIQRDCRAAGVPTFVKQLGAIQAKELGLKDRKGGDWSEWEREFQQREFPGQRLIEIL